MLDAKLYKRNLKNHFDNSCAYCGMKQEKLTIDHLVPKSKGGTDCPSNWVPACRNCNMKKSDQAARTWFEKQKFFNEDRWRKIIAVLLGEIEIETHTSYTKSN